MTAIVFPFIKMELDTRGETLQEFAGAIGISLQSLYRRMRGEVPWAKDEIDKIMEHFGKDYTYLFKEVRE